MNKFIEKEISENNIILFMKGNRNFPRCGFSAMVVGILQTLGVKFKDIDVLESEELRQGIKDFSDWPTIPQLYINKEFIGGCDIVREMYESGELSKLIREGEVPENIEQDNPASKVESEVKSAEHTTTRPPSA
ncbi:MAG: Grx4 family monothiol glutaredoxin [Rickettsiaceae bacterium]|nr:Grx4 family monothiol glutaredoxin [Rickettsiaceae bacterium]